MHHGETGTVPGPGQEPWRKSSYSNPNGNCVEMAPMEGGGVAVRNRRDPHGPILTYTRAEFAAFVHGIKADGFDDRIGEDAPLR